MFINNHDDGGNKYDNDGVDNTSIRTDDDVDDDDDCVDNFQLSCWRQ
jgi:hypothetical protein